MWGVFFLTLNKTQVWVWVHLVREGCQRGLGAGPGPLVPC